MVLDPRKRQKKLERKSAKRKAQLKVLSRQNPADLRSRFRNAATGPVLHSFASNTLWDEGIGYVLLSRDAGHGQFAFSAFLVDMLCLGAKDAMWGIRTRGELDIIVEKISAGVGTRKLVPECARKLVEGAVEYAANLGLSPHADYQPAKLIFGDIDTSACTEAFEYGRDGKPCFIAGPYDSPQRCRQIVSMLHAKLGADGYHFVMPADADLLAGDEEAFSEVIEVETAE